MCATASCTAGILTAVVPARHITIDEVAAVPANA